MFVWKCLYILTHDSDWCQLPGEPLAISDYTGHHVAALIYHPALDSHAAWFTSRGQKLIDDNHITPHMTFQRQRWQES